MGALRRGQGVKMNVIIYEHFSVEEAEIYSVEVGFVDLSSALNVRLVWAG